MQWEQATMGSTERVVLPSVPRHLTTCFVGITSEKEKNIYGGGGIVGDKKLPCRGIGGEQKLQSLQEELVSFGH